MLFNKNKFCPFKIFKSDLFQLFKKNLAPSVIDVHDIDVDKFECTFILRLHSKICTYALAERQIIHIIGARVTRVH